MPTAQAPWILPVTVRLRANSQPLLPSVAGNWPRGKLAVAFLVASALHLLTAGELELRDEIVSILSAENMFSDHTITIEAGERRETIHRGASDAGQIDVHIDGGTAILNGQVKSLGHRRFAEVLVWWRAGCARVINMLEVVPPQEDNDNEITDVVRMVLEKDPLVHAAQLRVGTAAGVVEMRGLVASEHERDLALMDAWYVPDVWDVVDHIEVRP